MQIKLGKPSASALIYPLACALVVIGAKCWMIGRYGNPTPFWDQWDAEGAVLYPRYLGGTYSLPISIAPHEHRILMTRLWSLLLSSSKAIGTQSYRCWRIRSFSAPSLQSLLPHSVRF